MPLAITLLSVYGPPLPLFFFFMLVAWLALVWVAALIWLRKGKDEGDDDNADDNDGDMDDAVKADREGTVGGV